MPRRNALDDKKKERLAQEHEHLQKLMLQARSSVRRSSLKERSGQDTTLPEAVRAQELLSAEETGAPVSVAERAMQAERETIKEEPATEAELFQKPIAQQKPEENRQPLTEEDLFPMTTTTLQADTEKRLLTETDIFPNARNADVAQPQKGSMVRVILPDQNVAAEVARPATRRTDAADTPRSVASPNTEITTRPALMPEERVPVEGPAAVYNDRKEKRNRPGKGAYLLLVAVLLACFGGYYLYQTRQNKNTSAKQTNVPASQTEITPPATSAPVPAATGNNEASSHPTGAAVPDNNTGDDVAASETNTSTATPKEQAQENANTQPQDKPLSEMLKDFDNVTVVEKPAPGNRQAAQLDNETATTAFGKYKVLSKAYFHNEPDESTRRKAFIIHWNNAVLTPLDEKNGFVYIVFTNHLGQTSKGWLRISDLRRIE